MGEYENYVKKHHLKPYDEYVEKHIKAIQKTPKDDNIEYYMADYFSLTDFVQQQQYWITQIYCDVINMVMDDENFDEIKMDLRTFQIDKILDISEGINNVTLTFHFQTAWNKHYIGYWWYSYYPATYNEPECIDGECGVLEEATPDGKPMQKKKE